MCLRPLESITFTTHGECTFLDNIMPLLERWHGPISVAIFAPGKDFWTAVQIVKYQRSCTSEMYSVRKFVTYHFFFPVDHMPRVVPHDLNDKVDIDCSKLDLEIQQLTKEVTYKKQNGLDYPVNVGRTIARDMANTYFVLASDIELYPNPGLYNTV